MIKYEARAARICAHEFTPLLNCSAAGRDVPVRRRRRSAFSFLSEMITRLRCRLCVSKMGVLKGEKKEGLGKMSGTCSLVQIGVW